MVNPVTELKKYQHAHSLSQVDLAKRIGITEGYISMVLSGYREAGPAVLKFLNLEKRVVTRVTYRRVNGSKA
jgi:transcriptional regulator with XRE-family HTH domain